MLGALAIGLILASAAPSGLAQATAVPRPNRVLHYFVIDHSSSMNRSAHYSPNEKAGRGREESLWECLLFDRAQDGRLDGSGNQRNALDRGWLDDCLRASNVPTDGTSDVRIELFNQVAPGRKIIGARPSGPEWRHEVSKWSKNSHSDVCEFLLNKVGPPNDLHGGDPEGTALWDALLGAIQTTRDCARHYDRINIYLFTDGLDTSSRAKGGVVNVEREWRALASQHTHVWLLELPIGEAKEKPPLRPELPFPGSGSGDVCPDNRHIRVERPELGRLVSARADLAPDPRAALPYLTTPQSVTLMVDLEGLGIADLERLSDEKKPLLRLRFDPKEPQDCQITVTPQTLRLQKGGQTVTLTANNLELARRGVTGALHCSLTNWPPSGQATDQELVQVNFLPASWDLAFNSAREDAAHPIVPIVTDVKTMMSADRWPAKQPMACEVQYTCSEEVEVSWDFGDGTQQTTGSRKAMHTWSKADTYTISVTCKPKAAGATAVTKTTSMRVFDIDARMTANDQDVRSGDVVVFTASLSEKGKPDSAIEIKAADWKVGSGSYAHDKAVCSRFEHKFMELGELVTECRALTDYGYWTIPLKVVVTTERFVQLTNVPLDVYAGTSTKFEARLHHGDPKDKLEWTFASDGQDGKCNLTMRPDSAGCTPLEFEVPRSWKGQGKVSVRVISVDQPTASREKDVAEESFHIVAAGLHKRRYPESDGVVVIGQDKQYEVQFTGSDAAKVEAVQWEFQKPGSQQWESAGPPRPVHAGESRSDWSFSITAEKAMDWLKGDKRALVRATPIINGQRDDRNSQEWSEAVRLPYISYVFERDNVPAGGQMEIGAPVCVHVSPDSEMFIDTVTVHWGDGGSPGRLLRTGDRLVGEHRYAYLIENPGRVVQAMIQRIDGETITKTIPTLRHADPGFRFVPTAIASVHLSRQVQLTIEPYPAYVRETHWSRVIKDASGNKRNKPVGVANRAATWIADEPGTESIAVTVVLKEGYGEAISLDTSYEVEASDTVKGSLTIEDERAIPGTIKIKFVPDSESDWVSIDVAVLRKDLDGNPIGERIDPVKGENGQTVFDFPIKKGEFGEYSFVAWAHRLATKNNMLTRVAVVNGTTHLPYRDNQWLLWLCVFVGTLGFGTIWMWASLLQQAPRKWTIGAAYVPRTDPSSMDYRTHRLRNKLKIGEGQWMQRWKMWQWKKELELSTGEIATLAGPGVSDEIRDRFNKAEENQGQKITINPAGLTAVEPWTRNRWAQAPETGSAGEEDVHVQRGIASTDPSWADESKLWDLQVWLLKRPHDESKRVALFVLITLVIILMNLYAGWQWFNVFGSDWNFSS